MKKRLYIIAYQENTVANTLLCKGHFKNNRQSRSNTKVEGISNNPKLSIEKVMVVCFQCQYSILQSRTHKQSWHGGPMKYSHNRCKINTLVVIAHFSCTLQSSFSANSSNEMINFSIIAFLLSLYLLSILIVLIR